jgi:hypothetical protein
MSNLKILILNGPAESGKGEVARIIKQYLPFEVIQYSSIDFVKDVAKEKFGWDGVKDVKGRNLLSAIKQSMIAYNDLPTKKIIEIINYYIKSTYLITIDVREPDEIDKLVKWCKEKNITCHTCRISNTEKELEAERSGLSLTGDRMYGRYNYDIYIYNNEGLYDLEQQTKEKFTNIYLNPIPKPNKEPVTIGSKQHEPPIEQTIKNTCTICNHGKLRIDKRTLFLVCDYCQQRYTKDLRRF